MVSEERVELNALLEVFHSFETADVFEEVEVAVGVNARTDQSVPVNTLEFDVGIVLLEREVERLAEVDVGTLDGVHILAGHFKLVKVEVFREDLHLNYYYVNYFIRINY